MKIQTVKTYQPNRNYTLAFQKLPVKKEYCQSVSIMINQPYEKIVSLLNNQSNSKVNLFDVLTEAYNSRNFYLKDEIKESSEFLIKIFQSIKKPNEQHFFILNSSKGSFESLSKIFEVAKDKKSLKFAKKMQLEILGNTDEDSKIIAKMLLSKNKKIYMKNPQDYKSYLALNKSSENVIEELDRLVESGKYDRKKYDSELKVNKFLKIQKLEKTFEEEKNVLVDNYTDQRLDLLDAVMEVFANVNKSDDEIAKNVPMIVDMYKSTTPKNADIRIGILEKLKFNTFTKDTSDDFCKNLEGIKNLFDKVDSDKNVKTFVSRIVESDLNVKTAKELDDILTTVPTSKGVTFFNNFAKIIRRTTPEVRMEVLKTDLTNPNYTTKEYREKIAEAKQYGFYKDKPLIVKLYDYVINKVKIAKYNMFDKNDKPIVSIFAKPAEKNEPKIKIVASNIKEPTVQKQDEKLTKTVVLKDSDGEQNVSIKIVNKIKETAKERKIRLSKEVNEYVKTKLGAKTYEKQQEGYTKNVTKMRLTLLPEIFDSIRETRKAARLEGKNPRSENSDAVKLYERINGKNRKLVRYMLKQKDKNGNRIFEVKNIINYIDQANSVIEQTKAASPELPNRYAKDYFDSLHTYLVGQYGKLKPQRKATSVTK